MMKILIAHNDYGKYSGEEAVVERMQAMLASRGHKVAMFRMTSAGKRETLKGKIHGFLAGIYSPSGVRSMREAIEREKPDIVNIHNLYPFISPPALKECKKAGVPVVMTVHNYRLMCPTGLFLRNGDICRDCLTRGSEWSCIRHNCEASLLKSIGYAVRNASARMFRLYKDGVDQFACLTNFQKDILIQAGFAPDKICVIPNFIETGPHVDPAQGEYVAYCGRLSYEKGIDLLIEVARRLSDIPFKVAGECRDESLLNDIPKNMTLIGHLGKDKLGEFYRNARFVTIPSRCYEGFPMTVLEAASYGKPCIVPRHGGFPDIIRERSEKGGEYFNPGDIESLAESIRQLWDDRKETERLGEKIKQRLEEEYTAEKIAEKWEKLINKTISTRKRE